MKPICLVLLALITISMVKANLLSETQLQSYQSTTNRLEVVVYEENFESGAPGWTHYDAAQSPNNWHIHNAGGTQANVWWMGDPALASGANIGGYYDHQYLVLNTPARTLTAANASLTFKMKTGLEDPAASGGYDGWDSANIRISTNGGTTWSVISGSPAYQFQNSYAFGYEHGEGMGIAGWGGITPNWISATFNLSAYVGQSVMIRFAFASDPAYSTADAPAMFGFMIDDISFGGYTNNGTNDGQMTFASLVPLGGDIWNLATEANAPSPTHVMKNQNAAGSYNINMLNYLVSPSITLPASGDIRADFMIQGSFADPDIFPAVDYFGWEISPDNGLSWRAMSNPYADPAGNNYVFSDAPDTWSPMNDSFSLDGLISDFAGQTVKFRWYFKSDADTPNGTGIMIDDFKIYNATTSVTQTISLASGWNLVSLNVSPSNHAISSLISAIAANVQQIKGTEGVYIPDNPYSTLTSLSDGKAYNILMSTAANWSVTGSAIIATTPIAMLDGWNMVAYLPQTSLPVATAMQSIGSWLAQVKGTDGVYLPDNPYSTLTTIYPNKGYWIKINGAHNLIYPGGSKDAVSVQESRTELAVSILSSSMTVLARCEGAFTGDILLARVNGELRGAEKFIAPEGFAAALIQIYTETAGEEICFSILKADGSELPISSTLNSQPQEMIGSYPSFLNLEIKAGDTSVPVPTRLLGCYPNPFNPSTTISFSIAQDNSPVSIEIYNLKGQKVTTLINAQLSKGKHSIVWNGKDDRNQGVASGVYFIRMNCGSYHNNTKIMLTK
ncbi:MAG: FlgD immunoglobulin-like domain containing protein [Candidatus Cloacimonetes bacterium]|nr:FlgD immunoglobulin-like domain containing protein [Candidatus Cloacimonadota bacterium]